MCTRSGIYSVDFGIAQSGLRCRAKDERLMPPALVAREPKRRHSLLGASAACACRWPRSGSVHIRRRRVLRSRLGSLRPSAPRSFPRRARASPRGAPPLARQRLIVRVDTPSCLANCSTLRPPRSSSIACRAGRLRGAIVLMRRPSPPLRICHRAFAWVCRHLRTDPDTAATAASAPQALKGNRVLPMNPVNPTRRDLVHDSTDP